MLIKIYIVFFKYKSVESVDIFDYFSIFILRIIFFDKILKKNLIDLTWFISYMDANMESVESMENFAYFSIFIY